MEAVIYTRVSTEDQQCDRQIADLTAFAARAGYTVTGIYSEKASGAKNDRIERKKIMKLAQARKIKAILVTEISRWGRSTQDLLSTLEELAGYGVSVVTVSGLQMDLSSPLGKLMVTMLSGIAEFERELTRERVKSGIANARARGKKIGRQAGDNYRSGSKTDLILKLKADGKSVREIAEITKLGKSTVHDVLSRNKAS